MHAIYPEKCSQYICDASEIKIKKLELRRNEEIYLRCRKKGQESKVYNTGNQNAAHTEDLGSESGNWSCLKKKKS